MNQRRTHLHTTIAAAVLVTAGMTSISALAAAPNAQERAQIQQTYRTERAACLDGSSKQEKGSCLAEATAARGEALRGELGLQTVARNDRAYPGEADLLANALSRCDPVPAGVRTDCERRVLGGDVIVIGSVAEGGIIRELATAEPVVFSQTDTSLPVIVAEATEPVMEAAPAGVPLYAMPARLPTPVPTPVPMQFPTATVNNQGLAAAEVTTGNPFGLIAQESGPMAAPLIEPLTEPMIEPQAAQALQRMEPAPAMQPAPEPLAAPFTGTPNGTESAPERSPYPYWLQPQRFE